MADNVIHLVGDISDIDINVKALIEKMQKASLTSTNTLNAEMTFASIDEELSKKEAIDGTKETDVPLSVRQISHVLSFEWSLENFTRFIANVHSSVFSATNCDKTYQASIALYGNPNNDHGYIKMFVTATSKIEEKIHGHFDLGVYNAVGDKLGQWTSVAEFTEERRCHMCFETQRPALIARGEKWRYGFVLYEDELIIKGRIEMSGCCQSTCMLRNQSFEKMQ